MEIKIDDLYLGDGVYASFDGFHITLDLRGQDNTTRIALEPPVFQMLISFNARIMREIERLSTATVTPTPEASDEAKGA